MPATPPPATVCLVRLSALGDVVMALPLVRAIQREWPGTKITWICGKGVFSVLSPLQEEGVELIAIDKPKRLGDYLAVRRLCQGRTFDVLLALQASWRANFLYPLIPARRKIGYGWDRAKDAHRLFVREGLPRAAPHIVDGFFQFGEAMGLPRNRVPRWDLTVPPGARAERAAEFPNRSYMALNACSSKAERDWIPERYAQVVAEVKRRYNLDTVLIGGPSPREKEMAAAILSRCPVPIVDRVGRTSLAQMEALLEGCAFLLAPDTGAVHIANALARPVCGLYAVAPSTRTGPYPSNEYCVDRFSEAVRTLQGRDPDKVSWDHRVHSPGAMQLISVDDVLAKVEKIVAKGVS